ncbi:MAG: DUF167 domain-containing protein [Patescibacteria group bacterium]
MRITVHAKPRAHHDAVEKISEFEYRVSITEPPIEGRANWAIIRLIADYFGVSQSAVVIISGATQRVKIIEVSM